jgi:hypothetical protein
MAFPRVRPLSLAELDAQRRKIEGLLRQARGLGVDPPADGYARHKRQAGQRQREQTLEGRDIGAIPEVADPSRKRACSADFTLFCKGYFPETFTLAWSDDHLKVIAQVEESVLRGGLFATAMPRGSGKTSIAEVACIWATLCGHRDFVALIGSDESHACQMLDAIKTELEGNPLLAQDFPEAVYPILKLDGIANRCNGQLHKGQRTHIGWTADEVVLPTIPGSKAGGAIIKVAGLTGGFRGMKFKRPDGRTVRPSLVVIDDPQTDSSARSRSQCQTRERVLAGAVLGLAGPGKKIAGIMPCTVIHPGDMADSILDRQKHPDWNGTRTKMVYAFPSAEKLWQEYGRIRADGLRAGDAGRAATEFYAANREAMDAGAVVAWPDRFNDDELSALQNAMNLRLRDERAFYAEYQNEPLPEDDARGDELTADEIAGKLNRLPRGLVPISCQRVTAMIDVQASLLYYGVVAWEDDFTGYVVDYGTYPDQKRPYFTLRDAQNRLENVTRAAATEGLIFAGLEALTAKLLDREWERDDGSVSRITRCLIDAGAWTDTILQFCRQSKHPAIVAPSHGVFVGPINRPFREYTKHPGDRVGHHWRMPAAKGRGDMRHVSMDINYWKSFLHRRFGVAMGDPGCLSLFGDKPQAHRMLADHLTAENCRPQVDEKTGRRVEVWKHRPERPDNHLLDVMVGCAVAASMEGVALPESAAPARVARPKRVSFAEIQKQRRA